MFYIYLECVDCLKDTFKIFIVVALPQLPLTEVSDLVDDSHWRICV